jgi:hypothetical protein
MRVCGSEGARGRRETNGGIKMGMWMLAGGVLAGIV